MKSLSFATWMLLIAVVFASAATCFAQESEPLPRLGVGTKVSTLGIGVEAATGVTQQSNVRGGFNMFSYDHAFSQDGIQYGAQLKLRSVEAHYDWFFGGFHVSPGVLIHSRNRVDGSADVPGGQSFTLGTNTYVSSASNPVTGSARIDFSKNTVSPMLTAGVGNILRRGGRRFNFSFEAGVVFQSSPQAVLNLGGSACMNGICQNVASTPQIQNDIRAEQDKINSGAAPYDLMHKLLKYYPVVSIGFGYRFK